MGRGEGVLWVEVKQVLCGVSTSAVEEDLGPRR